MRNLLPALGLLLILTASEAAGDPPAASSLSEIHEMERILAQQRAQRLRQVDDGVRDGTLDPDTASDRRFRIEQEYRAKTEQLARQREDTYRSLEAQSAGPQARKPDTSPSSPGVSALPKIPSQSVIEYPSNAPQSPERPQKPGEVKNVGIGVRELEF